MSESEKLQKLKDRVETQEMKLKKIRAMRGQVDYSKIMNGNLCMGGFFPFHLPLSHELGLMVQLIHFCLIVDSEQDKLSNLLLYYCHLLIV